MVELPNIDTGKWRIGSTFSNKNSPVLSNSPGSFGSNNSGVFPSRIVEGNLLCRHQGKLSIGQINRFEVHYNAEKDHLSNIEKDKEGEFLWLRVRNVETQFFRPIYFTGPFSFYIDVTPHKFEHTKDFDEPIEFNTDIKPGQSFKAKLRLNNNSNVQDEEFHWTVDVVSQLAMTTKFIINYDFMIGYDYKILRKVSSSTKPLEGSYDILPVLRQDTAELWTKPPPRPDEPVHLVVITHGIFSNVGADMICIKENIERVANSVEGSNVMVRGYDGNVGKSEKGIQYLGKRVAKFVVDLCDSTKYRIDRISFVGHSLGGPVQAYAITQIVISRPQFFQSIQPVNFISLAAPFLGILSEFPAAVSFALDIGALGKTGRDLTLSHKLPTIVKGFKKETNPKDQEINRKLTTKPTLEALLDIAHETFESFQNRTVYANAINDGIVPLRTSALLYLDWKGLGDLKKLKQKYEEGTIGDGQEAQHGQRVRKGSVGEIPENAKSEDRDEKEQTEETEESRDGKELKKTASIVSYVTANDVEVNKPNGHNVSDPNLKTSSESNSSNSNEGDEKKIQIKENKDKKKKSSETSTTLSLLREPTTIFKHEPKKSKRKKLKKYVRTQTRGKVGNKKNAETEEDEEEEWMDFQGEDDEIDKYNIPPAASTFLSAANVMLSPVPDREYIMYPSHRAPSIFHDKRYNYDDLPPPHYTSKMKLLKQKKSLNFVKPRNKNMIEEKIARSWHWKMEWRKVLVTLKPDAHNNIAVRRKYSNAFGWAVLDHLAENHFGEEALGEEKLYVRKIRERRTEEFNTNLDTTF